MPNNNDTVNTNTASLALVTIKNGSTVVASLTLVEGEVVQVEKAPSPTLVASDAVKVVKIAYTN